MKMLTAQAIRELNLLILFNCWRNSYNRSASYFYTYTCTRGKKKPKPQNVGKILLR